VGGNPSAKPVFVALQKVIVFLIIKTTLNGGRIDVGRFAYSSKISARVRKKSKRFLCTSYATSFRLACSNIYSKPQRQTRHPLYLDSSFVDSHLPGFHTLKLDQQDDLVDEGAVQSVKLIGLGSKILLTRY
jgi:hypothetical protein